jgi:hypothetical protein
MALLQSVQCCYIRILSSQSQTKMLLDLLIQCKAIINEKVVVCVELSSNFHGSNRFSCDLNRLVKWYFFSRKQNCTDTKHHHNAFEEQWLQHQWLSSPNDLWWLHHLINKYRIVSFWHFLREDNGRSTFIILNVSTTVIGVPIYHELVYTLTATNEQVSLLALTPQRE